MRLSKFSLSVLAVLLAAFSQASFRVLTGSHGPENQVQVNRPTFKWEIWPADAPASVTGVDFRLDGSSVPARYDTQQRAVLYTPERALNSGTHIVEVEVTFAKLYKFAKSWNTTVTTRTVTLPAASSAQQEILRVANAYRSMLGLPSMSFDNRLNFAAQKHSEYLADNNLMGHNQAPNTPGFFGVTGADRLASIGWAGGSWEGVTYGSSSVSQGIKQLFDAPYHRLPFMQPGQLEFGGGFSGSRMTVEFENAGVAGTVVSPSNGQNGVPVSWKNTERPNPLRMHGADSTTGYPIVLARFSGDQRRIRISSASLSLNGQVVPVYLNTPANDSELNFAAIIFPKLPLKPGATYRATFSGSDERGARIETSSSFTTAG